MRNYYDREIARPSHIRPALGEVLGSGERHDWSIDDLRGALAKRGVTADFSSVFRALRVLEREGSVVRIELGDGRARFEAAGGHHEHIRCDRCGAVAAVPGCLVENAGPLVERRTGFSVTSHRLLFSGLCPGCATGAKA